jgi:ferredoxin
VPDMTGEVKVDATICIGSGNCADAAPAAFRLGDDGVAVPVVARGLVPLERLVWVARQCPVGAISVYDDGRMLYPEPSSSAKHTG